jgi:hypothetical protein
MHDGTRCWGAPVAWHAGAAPLTWWDPCARMCRKPCAHAGSTEARQARWSHAARCWLAAASVPPAPGPRRACAWASTGRTGWTAGSGARTSRTWPASPGSPGRARSRSSCPAGARRALLGYGRVRASHPGLPCRGRERARQREPGRAGVPGMALARSPCAPSRDAPRQLSVGHAPFSAAAGQCRRAPSPGSSAVWVTTRG